MTLHKRRGRRLFFLAATTLLTLSAVIAVFSERKQNPKTKSAAITYKADRVTQVPSVESKVKDLQIGQVSIVHQGTPIAAIAIEIINKSSQPVMALELTAGDDNDWSGLGIDGLDDPDKPQIQIQPYSLKVIQWGLGEILKDYPIVVSAATFGDGKEDGDAHYLEVMRNDRRISRAERKATKEKGLQP